MSGARSKKQDFAERLVDLADTARMDARRVGGQARRVAPHSARMGAGSSCASETVLLGREKEVEGGAAKMTSVDGGKLAL